MDIRTVSAIVGSWTPGGPEHEQSDIASVRLGLQYARGLAEDAKWRTVWLVTNTADNLRGRTITAALGAQDVQSLRAGREVRLGALSFQHGTMNTIGNRGVGESILAVHPSPATLDRLDGLMNTHSLVVVPGPMDIGDWIGTWGPFDVTTATRRPRLEIGDPEVLAEVETIVSHYTGLGHRDDERRVRATFQRLRRRGRNVDPKAIRAYVVRETGWGAVQADELAKIAAGRSKE